MWTMFVFYGVVSVGLMAALWNLRLWALSWGATPDERTRRSSLPTTGESCRARFYWSRGFAPRTPPTRALARRLAGALRSRGSLTAFARSAVPASAVSCAAATLQNRAVHG
jgi:hypothetical protein